MKLEKKLFCLSFSLSPSYLYLSLFLSLFFSKYQMIFCVTKNLCVFSSLCSVSTGGRGGLICYIFIFLSQRPSRILLTGSDSKTFKRQTSFSQKSLFSYKLNKRADILCTFLSWFFYPRSPPFLLPSHRRRDTFSISLFVIFFFIFTSGIVPSRGSLFLSRPMCRAWKIRVPSDRTSLLFSSSRQRRHSG